MITFEGMPQNYKVSVMNFHRKELDSCLQACERAEVQRSNLKRGVDGDAIKNLTGTIFHYEGRILQLRRTLAFLTTEKSCQCDAHYRLPCDSMLCENKKEVK